MNKKILALAMIPLLIGLSGAMAFSQFTGTDSKSITATAGTFSMTEGAAVSRYYASSGSMMTVGGPVEDGHAAVTWSPASSSDSLGTSTLVAGESSMTYDITVSNIAPGEWVNVTFTLTNTGSLAITLLPGTLTTGQSGG
ncbi:MAG: M73 family metallopeptidase, partial [Thermoplasmata archaeon]|nr:M73 family metallopeptidase [Candidatus Sysuiplasma acidicola]